MSSIETALPHGLSVVDGRHIEVQIERGRIGPVRVCASTPDDDDADHRKRFISPGFFDIQVNGYYGSDYSLDSLSYQDILGIRDRLAAAGTTQHIPTIVTLPRERLLRNLSVIAHARDNDWLIRHAIPGIHLEGPYVSSADGPRGAHDAQYVRDPDYSEFRELQEASRGSIVMLTLAPERKGAIAFIEKLVADGICVGIGHSEADPDTIDRAVQAGARVSTHLGNGSHVLIPRLRNYIWEQLARDELYAGIISDGFHLPPSVVKVFFRAKGLDRLILVSDAAFLGGCEPGIYKWGNIDVEVFPDGHLGLPGTEVLAGAGQLLDWSIAHFHRFTGVSVADTIELCTRTPAALLDMRKQVTQRLQVGEPANIVEFEYSESDSRLRVQRTITAGVQVFPSRSPCDSDTATA